MGVITFVTALAISVIALGHCRVAVPHSHTNNTVNDDYQRRALPHHGSNTTSLAGNNTDVHSSGIATQALGINCRGSSYCSPCYVEGYQLNDFIAWSNVKAVGNPHAGHPDREYRNGEYIFCEKVQTCYGTGFKSFCLFPQHMAKGSTLKLSDAHQLVRKLSDHRCEFCGSIPIAALEGSNDPAEAGILTVNYVSNPHCNEWCMDGQGARA